MEIKDYLTNTDNFIDTKNKITSLFMDNYSDYRKRNHKRYLTKTDYYAVVSDTVTSLLDKIKTEGIKV